MNVHKLVAYDRAHPDGSGTALEEKLLLYALIKLYRAKRVLEIGVSAGHSTLWLAQAVSENNGQLTALDNWSRTNGGRAGSEKQARKRLMDNGLQRYVSFVSTDSQAFLQKQADGSFDVVWVDGDHAYLVALADVKEAARVASQLVVVHDTAQRAYSTVRRACKESGLTGSFLDAHRGLFIVAKESYDE